jgi:hypothetical protein
LVSHMLLGFTDSNLRRTLSSNKGTAWTSVTELVQYLSTIMAYEVHTKHSKHAGHNSALTQRRPNKFTGQKRPYDGQGQQQQLRRRFGQGQQQQARNNFGANRGQPNRQPNGNGAAPGQNPQRAQFPARNNAGPQLNAGQAQFNGQVDNPQLNVTGVGNRGGPRAPPVYGPNGQYCWCCKKNTHNTIDCSIVRRVNEFNMNNN